MLALVVIMLLLLAWALVAGRLARYSVTAPLALLVAGVVLTAGQNPVFFFDIPFEAAEPVVEVILAILLFTDATEVPGGILGQEPRLTLRLLLIALPLSLAAAWLFGVLLFGGRDLWLLLVLATVASAIYLGWHSPSIFEASTRLSAVAFWGGGGGGGRGPGGWLRPRNRRGSG